MEFEEWVETVPGRVKAEACWKFEAYPRALYLYELAWEDCDALMRDERGRAVARQLIRSAGSISANIEEGYARGVGGKDYLYFLRVAEGSARESKGWLPG
jgi:four helix bundle protein